MGSVENVKNMINGMLHRPRTYKVTPGLVFELLKARDKALFKVLDQMGVSKVGLVGDGGKIDQAGLKLRMKLAGISLKLIKHHADPRENGIVVFKGKTPAVSISQPYIKEGVWKCDIHEAQSSLIIGAA